MPLSAMWMAESGIVLARSDRAPVSGRIAPDFEHDRPAANFAILDVALRVGAGVDHDAEAFAAIRTGDWDGGIRVHSAARNPTCNGFNPIAARYRACNAVTLSTYSSVSRYGGTPSYFATAPMPAL